MTRRAIRIKLPGHYVPEVAGKSVTLFGEVTETFIELHELNGDPPDPSSGISLTKTFIPVSTPLQSDIDSLGREIEEAALEYFRLKDLK